MDKKWILLVFILALVAFSISNVNADTFELNGTVYDVNSNALNNTNVSVTIKDQTWAQVGVNSTTTNATGWFNLTIPGNATDRYMYQLVITHTNNTTGHVDYVGQSLPSFPYVEFSQLSNVNYYLKEAGTINITAINSTGNSIQFAYQIKDTKLGYPIADSQQGTSGVIAYVPKEKNYSIMVYPAQGSGVNFVPVSYDWNNFTATEDYNIGSLSSYNATTKTLKKQFNTTESQARISGYLNASEFNITGWDEFTVVPFLLEPGDMIFMTYGVLPYNASAFFPQSNLADEYNLTTYDVNASGFYNITLPFASAETVKYILFAAGKNGTYYGAYRNITVTGNAEINFTMRGLLGDNSTINMSTATGGFHTVNTTRQTFQLINSTNHTLSNVNAHIEITVDYSGYDAIEFTFMEDLSESNNGNFSIPLLNVTGFKEMNVYSMDKAPKRVPTRTVAQIISNNNITMTTFNPQTIGGTTGASISINIYRSNSTCDVPNPIAGCSLTSSSDMSTFNPFSIVMGGGKISFRMGIGDVLVHYVDVDMLASGPPDALFDSNDDVTEGTTDGFSKAMRFGSNGPTIYDYVLVSMPYTEGSSSQTGLNESGEVNMSVPTFYDENWNVVWNTSLNGTNATNFAGNHSHYSTYQSEWETLMGNNTCVTNVTQFNATSPCYINTTSNRIWIRLPHFSGTGPDVDGDVITATATTTTPSDGDGGTTDGGAVTNVTKKKAKTWLKITPGAAEIMKIDDPEIGLKMINITVRNPAHTVTITVTKLEGKPASVVHEITGKVYKYIEIEAKNLADENVDEGKIQFQVEKTWISENNIDRATIALNRYHGNKWNKLPTQEVDEDDDYVYYEAETPGFTTFAITGEEIIVTTTAATTTVPATTIPVTTTVPVKPIEEMMSIWSPVIIIIVVVIGVLWVYRKKIGLTTGKK